MTLKKIDVVMPMYNLIGYAPFFINNLFLTLAP